MRYVPGHLGKPWLAARLNDHLKHHPLTATARTHNSAVFPVLTSDAIQRYLWLFGAWEPHLTAWMRARLAPGDLVVDAGAHTGHSAFVKDRFPSRPCDTCRGPVTRSPRDARRLRCRRGVRIGCALGPTSSHRQDTQPAPPMRRPARPPTRRQLSRFGSQLLRSGGTTDPGGAHHPRPFMIVIVVTLRGSGTESDPEPRFKARRHSARAESSPVAPPSPRAVSGHHRSRGEQSSH
ncbi:methyltransferase [Streptomyces sp. NL15-2K]|nr:methyltransferase [Streptomyces sp. NL15-2K]